MKSIFFISDAHLGFDDEKVEAHRVRLLLDFLKYVESKGKMLVINGDVFENWYEYRSVIPRKYINILLALKQMSNLDIDVHYVTGNHDFWMGDFWQKQMGVHVHREPLEIELNGKQFYIAHGDGLAKKDTGYRLLKRILRHPWNICLFRFIHPDIGFALARFSSRLSRHHRVLKDKDSEYIEFARERFKMGYDHVILGHTHRPHHYEEDQHVYMNTGDWMDKFSYVELSGDQLMLSYWSRDGSKIK